MYNKAYTPAPQYYTPRMTAERQGYEVNKVGNIARTNTIVRRQQEREQIEAMFMRQAQKAIRSESQREARRAKR